MIKNNSENLSIDQEILESASLKKQKAECYNKYFTYKLCTNLVKDFYFEKSECDKYKNYIEKYCNNFDTKSPLQNKL